MNYFLAALFAVTVSVASQAEFLVPIVPIGGVVVVAPDGAIRGQSGMQTNIPLPAQLVFDPSIGAYVYRTPTFNRFVVDLGPATYGQRGCRLSTRESGLQPYTGVVVSGPNRPTSLESGPVQQANGWWRYTFVVNGGDPAPVHSINVVFQNSRSGIPQRCDFRVNHYNAESAVAESASRGVAAPRALTAPKESLEDRSTVEPGKKISVNNAE